MLKMKKRISLQTFFMPQALVVVASNAEMDAMKDTSEACDLDDIPPVSTSTSIVGPLGEPVAGGSSTSTLLNSNSLLSRSSPPPSFLLDEDPFANLASVKVEADRKRRSGSRSSVGSVSGIIPHNQRPPSLHPELVPALLPPLPISSRPKSRLQETVELDSEGRRQNEDKELTKKKRKRAKTFFVTMSAPVSPSKGLFSSSKVSGTDPTTPVPPLSTPSLNLTSSVSLPPSPRLPTMSDRAPLPPPGNTLPTGRIQPRPAHQRPAFAGRPSLPSLDTLARMNIVLTKKVRKGHVGAGLPFEPWDKLPSDDDLGSSHQSTSSSTPITGSTTAQVNLLEFPPDVAFDRTHPSCFSVPTSPTQSFRSFTNSPLTTPPPQPLLPSQVVALGSLVDDLEMDLSRSQSRSPPSLATSLLKPDVSILPSLPLSSILTATPGELDDTTVAPTLLPSVPEDLEVPPSKVFEPEMELMVETQPISHANGPAVGEESSYFNGDILDDYGISLTSEDELLDHPRSCAAETNDQQGSVNDFRQEPGSANLADGEHQLQANLRWSVETDESNNDPQLCSRTRSPSDAYPNSCAESFSDLFAMPSCPHVSYSYGYSTSDMDSVTDVSREFSLSRSISSTSFSSSSFDEEVHSAGNNLRRFRSRACNASQSSQSTDSSLGTYEQVRCLSKSGINSLLHSPDSEWMSFQQPELSVEGGLSIKPELAGVDRGPSQTTRIETAIQIPAASTIQLYEPHNGSCDIQDHAITSSQLCNGVDSQPESHSSSDANGLNWPATADNLFLTPPTTISFSSSSPDQPDPLLQADQAELSTVATATAPALSSDHTSLSEAPSSFCAKGTFWSPPPRSSSLSVSSEQLQDENQDMIDPSTRGKVGYVAGIDNRSPYRGYNRPSLSSREAKHNVLSPGHVEYVRNGPSITERVDILLPLDPRSQSRSVSRSRSLASNLPPPKQQFPSNTFTPSTQTSEDEDDHDDRTSSGDDIPLAQRIPGALTAQQVIRRKVKEERRAEREKRHRERQITLRPAGGTTVIDSPASQAVTPAVVAPQPTNNNTAVTVDVSLVSQRPALKQRPRTNTMPSKPSAPEFGQTFNAEDLSRKLQAVKMMTSPIHARQPQCAPLSHASSLRRSETKSKQRYDQEHTAPHSVMASPSTSAPLVPTLKSKRSFHAVDKEYRAQTLDQTSVHKRSMSISRGDKESSRQVQDGSIPPLPSSSRVSMDDHRDRGRRILVKTQADPRTTSTTTSAEVEGHRERPSTNGGLAIDAHGGPTIKQRIFIHCLQHQHLVDIGPMTSAGDLIATCEADGSLENWAGLGGWMIWEIAQDFGMERPVRNYELLSEVQASWLKEKTVNYFLLKKTLLSEPLGRSAIPSSAPTHSGWVEWESRRGKWSKRWMHLKENAVYLSKKDGRDETLLCSLSNFDAYYLTRSHRAPKPFTFSIKSTDSLSFFENTDDYMHTFSCSEKVGEAWVTKILIARSYVLHQERQALFNPKTTINPVGMGTSITRSGTRRTTLPKPTQPLVNLATGGIFEPGSLLSKQQGNQQS